MLCAGASRLVGLLLLAGMATACEPTRGDGPSGDQVAAARRPLPIQSAPIPNDLPAPAREFRGVWVATVDNIDWPSKPGLRTEQQQAELIALLNRAASLRLNAVIFQVRPACDALYASSLEPWSDYLTGRMGQAPSPLWDPLAFAVEEAHRRGLELHAWFNPYRARHPSSKSPLAPGHVGRLRPDLVRTYGKQLWLDPGEPDVQDYSFSVVMDVVRRYDVDGIHFDDYFYPYPERTGSGSVPFPDDASWRRYQSTGGVLNRADWRRDSVDRFIQRVSEGIHKEKPWVRFGISPFGIWRPGNPAQIRGFDAYAELYADARKWLANGWADYFAPQLYWKTEAQAQSYPVLLKWWSEQNLLKRHLWPGNYTSQVGAWPVAEITNQIRLTRRTEGASGNIHFSMKPLMQDRAGLSGSLESSLYSRQALPPATPWLDDRPPPSPEVRGKPPTLTWTAGQGEAPWLWVVRLRRSGAWEVRILPAQQTTLGVSDTESTDLVAISAVDRCGNESKPFVLNLSGSR